MRVPSQWDAGHGLRAGSSSSHVHGYTRKDAASGLTPSRPLFLLSFGHAKLRALDRRQAKPTLAELAQSRSLSALPCSGSKESEKWELSMKLRESDPLLVMQWSASAARSRVAAATAQHHEARRRTPETTSDSAGSIQLDIFEPGRTTQDGAGNDHGRRPSHARQQRPRRRPARPCAVAPFAVGVPLTPVGTGFESRPSYGFKDAADAIVVIRKPTQTSGDDARTDRDTWPTSTPAPDGADCDPNYKGACLD